MKTMLHKLLYLLGLVIALHTGLRGQSAFFNGSPQSVHIGDLDVTGNQLTVEALVYTNSGPGNIVSKHTGPPDVNYLLRYGNFEMTTSNGYTNTVSSIPLNLNTWYHVAATYDGQFVRYYVNGCLTAQNAWSGNLVQSNLITSIGQHSTCMCEQWLGYIDEVRIWNVVRSQSQLSANMTNLVNPPGQAGLIASYSFSNTYANTQGNPTWNGNPINAVSFQTQNSPLPTEFNIQSFSANPPACVGQNSGSLSITVAGGIPPYAYSLDNVNYQPSNTFNNLAPGNYTVYARSGGCLLTQQITVPPATPLTATVTSVNPLCNGQSNGTATANPVGGAGNYTYAWSPSGGTNATATGLAAGTYTVTVTDVNNCQTTAQTTLVNPTQVTVSIPTSANPLCNGGSTGSATANGAGGTGNISYAWLPSGGNAATATGLAANTYTVNATDANGCQATAQVTLTNPPLLTASIPTTTNPLCNGGSTGSATATATGGTGTITYGWTPTGGSALIASGLAAGNYTFIATDGNGCQATATTTLTNPTLLVAGILNTANPLCTGQSNGSITATASGGTGNLSYGWTPSGGSALTANGLAAGNYTFTVTDANGCTATSSSTLTDPAQLTVNIPTTTAPLCNGGATGTATANASGGTGAITYAWTPSGGANATATGLAAGTYTVTVTDGNNCQATAQATLTDPTAVTVTATAAPQDICTGQLTTLTATPNGGAGNFTYAWDNGPTTATQTVSPATTTTYTVIATDGNGCASPQATVQVNVSTPINPTAIATGPICEGQTANLSATATGGDSNYIFSWDNGAGVGPGPLVVSPIVTTTYTVTVTDGCGTPPATAQVTVTVNQLPIATITANPLQGCQPLPVSFTATSQTGVIATYAWSFGDGNTSALNNPTNTYTNDGVYDVTLTLTTIDGCTATFTEVGFVTVDIQPKADFIFTPQNPDVFNPEVQFVNQSVGGTIYDWDFGDGNLSNSQNPLNAYADTGRYTITLTVSNPSGCNDVATASLYVGDVVTVYIPNAFTPNSNTVNDVFLAKGSGVETYEMRIFNRWGELVFITQNPAIGWDGLERGKPAPSDVYVYTLNITDYLGREQSYKGKVNLLR